MPAWRWTLHDPTVPETVTLPLNPNTAQTPGIKKTVTRRATTAPGGRLIRFEGLDEPQGFKWDGVLLTEEHLNLLYEWADKRHQVLHADDLGRQWWIYITSLEFTRKTKHGSRWYHEYSLEADVLDGG